MRVDRRLIGWGLIFIVGGAVPLAVRAGLLDRDLVARWPELWPLAIIAVGLSLLLSRTTLAWLGTLTAALVIGAMGGGLLATGLGDIPRLSGCSGGSSQAFPSQGGTLADGGRVDVDFNCGTLAVGTAAGAGWTLSGTDGDGRVPLVEMDPNAVTIHPVNDPAGLLGRGRVAWTLTLPQDPTLDLGVTMNAGDGTLDLGPAKIASLNATVNAGSLTTSLGPNAASNAVNVTVNAGSASITTAATAGTFNLSLNAGSLDVCVPKGSAIRVRWSGALASHDWDAIGLVQVDDHTWTTAGFNVGQAHVELDVSANAGSFGLSFGGGCNAS